MIFGKYQHSKGTGILRDFLWNDAIVKTIKEF